MRKEAAHQNILGATNNDTQGIGTGLVTTEAEGLGLTTKGQRRFDGKKNGAPTKEDKSHLKCTNCGMAKHTKEQCFRLVGYPDWWTDGHKKNTKWTGPEKGNASATLNNRDNTDDRKSNRDSTGFGGVAFCGSGEASAKGNQFEGLTSNFFCNPKFFSIDILDKIESSFPDNIEHMIDEHKGLENPRFLSDKMTSGDNPTDKIQREEKINQAHKEKINHTWFEGG